MILSIYDVIYLMPQRSNKHWGLRKMLPKAVHTPITIIAQLAQVALTAAKHAALIGQK